MKIYAVVKDTAYVNKDLVSLFSSEEKALGYIISIVTKEYPVRGYNKEENWYNASWCYDTDKLFDSKNWDKYKYVTDDGKLTLYIEQLNVL